MKGDLFIKTADRWLDAYDNWGVSLGESALTNLMTPAAPKAFVANESRLEDGKRYILSTLRLQERKVTLDVNMVAKDRATFLRRYEYFLLTVRIAKVIKLKHRLLPYYTFRLLYNDCTNYTQYLEGGIAKMSLTFTEPDPTDRENENPNEQELVEETEE